MAAYDVAIFFIAVMLGVNILAASGIMGSDIPGYFGGDIELLNTTVQSSTYSPQPDEKMGYMELAISSFGLLVRSLVVIIMIFAYSTILLPVFLSMLGMPAQVNAALTIIVWTSYIVGYAQYKGRTTLSGVQ